MITEGEPHNCQLEIERESVDEVADEPLDNPDLTLYVDGSRWYVNGQFRMGWAVVNQHGTVVGNGGLERTLSAQMAELVALTEALRLAEGKRENIFTDSRHAFGVVHGYMAAWSRRGYLTSMGGHIKHENVVRELVEAARRPTKAAVIKIKAH
ncbi:ribonuclease H-like [Heterodontus francisci]|uniref:ribonuclease H-like n=1 Tax=Heterodontus francisci TaxID=7792 RepID=UPI00355B1CB8